MHYLHMLNYADEKFKSVFAAQRLYVKQKAKISYSQLVLMKQHRGNALIHPNFQASKDREEQTVPRLHDYRTRC